MIGIPYRLAFAGARTFEPKGSPGAYGDAGWTIWHVTADKLLGALAALPRAAWMPGTYRLATEHGIAV